MVTPGGFVFKEQRLREQPNGLAHLPPGQARLDHPTTAVIFCWMLGLFVLCSICLSLDSSRLTGATYILPQF